MKMKQLNIITVLFAFSLLMVSCEDTNENLVQQRGVGVNPIFTNLYPETPMFIDAENDSVTFSVFLAEGDAVDKATVRVTYQGKVADVKQITLTSDTLDVKIFGSEVLTALGITKNDLVLGTSFLINVTTTKYGVTTISQASFYISLPCEYDATINNGSYSIVSSEWNVDAGVSIVADENDPNVVYVVGIAEADGLSGNGNKLKLTIDPVTFKVTGVATILAANCGGWGSDYESYTNYTYTVVSGTYFSCDGNYKIVFNISVDQSDFGDYAFTLTK
jgi:hypothetical protein